MPFHFEFDPMHGILRGRIEGVLTDQSLQEYYRLAGEHVARTQPRCGITDFSAVTSFDVSPEVVRELARQAPAMPDPTRPRVAVAPSDLVFGMVRMFQSLGAQTRPALQVVRTMEEAYALLGVQGPRFEPLEEADANGAAR